MCAQAGLLGAPLRQDVGGENPARLFEQFDRSDGLTRIRR
jgi:hypothetical protein